jgi:transposase
MYQQEASPMGKLSVLGIDLAKQVFHLVGMDAHGTIVVRKRLYRAQVMVFIAQLPPTLIGMEACGGAHYWARRFREHGHDVKLMAPQFVTPYRKANKNDMRDAEAIAEAVTRPTMRFVPVKSVAQQDLQALHRVRERLMKARTALINETRGLLLEYGIIVPPGATTFRKHVLERLATQDAKLTPLSLALFQQLLEELGVLDARVATYDAQLAQVAQTHPVCQRLMTIPGLGELTATALVAAVSNAAQFKNGRQFAAWLGLVPRQHSTGGKPRLLGISKHGDSYLRKLLVHGARSCLRWVGRKPDHRSQWVRALMERRGWNRAAVALANKNARVAWVLMGTAQGYRTAEASAA